MKQVIKHCAEHTRYEFKCVACKEAWAQGCRTEDKLREQDVKEGRLFKPKTVAELSEALSHFKPSMSISATWEGVGREPWIYASEDGVLLIDADPGLDYELYIGRTKR
jgi:hypothetical protein